MAASRKKSKKELVNLGPDELESDESDEMESDKLEPSSDDDLDNVSRLLRKYCKLAMYTFNTRLNFRSNVMSAKKITMKTCCSFATCVTKRGTHIATNLF